MADPQLTIDDLAARTGMTVRNIRAHQSRGLVPPPEVVGRVGIYGAAHVERIELIQTLQADGFNLELIRRLIESGGGSTSQVLRFHRALREPFGDEAPQVLEAAELAERWRTTDAALLEHAERLGLLRALGDGRYEERSPRAGRVSAELARLGIDARQALEVAALVRRNADDVAAAFARLFVDAIWEPFERAGRPAERWQEVADALERLRPLASDAVLGIFQLAMDDAVERQFGQELDRLRDEIRDAEAS